MASHTLVLPNKPLNLTCLPQGDFTSIQWLKENQYLQHNHQLHSSDGNQTLVRTGVTLADSGAYQCEVRNLANCSSSDPVVISVAYGPDAVEISPSGNITQLFGSPLNLTCSADSVPAAEYSWFFNNTLVGLGRVMTINSTAWTHEGIYECWAYNALTNLTGRALVTVSVVIVASQESPSVQPTLIPRIISGTVIGILAGVVLIVIPVYCFCVRVQSQKPPQVPPIVSQCDKKPPDIPAKHGPKLENSPDPNSMYQELQCGDEALYQELER
ncbi:carcinoembryonic antigen-related cell adhesion molecule 8-like [Heteronotia binoei]|uniref:carcinoembryonic antigen-related cell adhesion molecule 8-like n=1 Tax=Heteronotia binoei TaxID=13085 RepID=UPI00292DC538|nr:carcinoembryonic antigen-related cell adhesion molecule 8-like [Heteronotia binoei]